ncbi:putative 26.5 kDa heat shock protein, mitochondrial-like [Capsicum annuum]|nr:putative 26.5 kDa heat shock protein, mitochondrial-like [Capsicum annuum]
MPKDRRVNLSSFNGTKVSPYACSSKNTDLELKSSLPSVENEREWEEAKCPICIEHPHNAVLLVCSSGEKGCRPFMCDTSYRHSNCLDQFCKLSSGKQSEVQQTTSRAMLRRGNQQPELVCPLCRGQITGWIVVEAARKFMNSKHRNCSLETCNFNGNYGELRNHARLEHPSDKPAEADPQRLVDWRRLETQRDLGDTLSAYQVPPIGEDVPGDEFFELPHGLFDFLDEFSEAEGGLSEDSNSLMDFEFDFSFLNDFPDFTWSHEELRMGNEG